MEGPQPTAHTLRLSLAGLQPAFDLLRLHAAFPARYPVVLESAAGSVPLARYDIVFAFPEDQLELGADWRLHGPHAAVDSRFLAALDGWWSVEARPAPWPAPFGGGWFLFLGYELAQQIEPRLQLVPAAGWPVARAVRVPVALIRDRCAGRAWVVAERGREKRLHDIEADLRRVAGADQAPRKWNSSLLAAGTAIQEDAPDIFLRAVAAAQAHIAAGDIYQANLARTWRAQLAASVQPWMVYRQLRKANPAPFSGLAVLDDMAIICSSPERLVTIRDGTINTRPIAGTRPRRLEAGADEQYRRDLVANPKERAEHVMLVDLERNDLGRLCEPGSVRVNEFMAVESYAHVHHIVSNVTGRLRADTTPGSVIRAVFPGGTITGCPKVRCMELIRTLESEPRGVYTGAMGYLNRDGSADLNILIRTMKMRGNELTIHAGSGIVADSDAARELDETRAKAKGMLLSLETPWTPGW
jgi:anthranilate synthase component 1